MSGLVEKFRDRWVVRPDVDVDGLYGDTLDWDDGAPGAYDRRVDSFIDGTTLYSVVDDGLSKLHVVVQQTDGRVLATQCECTMSMFMRDGRACDHIVMALRHLSDNFEELTSESYMREKRVSDMLNAVTPQQALGFLSDLLVENPGAYRKFADDFGMRDRFKSDRDYETELDRFYYMSLGHDGKVDGGLSFDRYFEAARAAADGARSIGIHRAVSEAIQRNIGIVDDSDGYYTDCLIESIENMAEAVLGLPDRREHIKYMVGAAAKARRDVARHYRSALETVCASDGDLVCLRTAAAAELLAGGGDGGERGVVGGDMEPWQVAELTRLQVYALEEGGSAGEGEAEGEGREGMEAILRRLAGSYRLDSDLRVLYIRCLGRSGADGARQAAMGVVREFPDDVAALEAALDGGIIGGGDPEYADLATRMFASTGDWKYYDRLGEAGAWSAADAVRGLLGMGQDGRALEVCLREKMHDEAMGVVESKRDLALFARHVTDLGKMYPGRYFEAYASRIREIAASRPDAKARRGRVAVPARILKKIGASQHTREKYAAQMRDHLLRIRELGDDRYRDLVKYVRSRNSRSAPFLAAIHDL